MVTEKKASIKPEVEETKSGNTQQSTGPELILNKHLEILLTKFAALGGATANKEDFNKLIVQLLFREKSFQNEETIVRSSSCLFDKIDWKNRGTISWDDVCSFLLLQVKEDDGSEKQLPFDGKPHIVKYSNLKDNIARVVPESNPARFIMISKTGHIGMISSDLSVTKQLHMEEYTEAEDTGKKRRTKLWVTDCLCVKELNKLIVSTANRDIQFFDLASPHCSQQFHLYDLPCAVLCMVYHYVLLAPYDELWLFFGTDNGDVHWLKFHMATKSLFDMPFKKSDSCWRIVFGDIANQSKFVSHQQFSHMHSDWVKEIQYVPQGDLLFSCSNNGRDSLVYRSLNENKRKVYVFRVTKGIECFAYSKDLALIATGGVDHVLRLWDPYVTAKPMAILKTHQTPVIDVMIYEPLEQVFSYSKDGTLISWDIKDHSALQCLHIKFPTPSFHLEHGSFPMRLVCHGNSPSLFIAAEDFIADVRLSSLGNQQINTTHKSSVVDVYPIVYKNQVISTGEFGDISSWDVETGRKLVCLQDKNQRSEVMAFAIDETAEYAVTGHLDGSGNLWNLMSGIREKALVAFTKEEITNCVVLPNASLIFMLGWSKRILAYKNLGQNKKLPTLRADEGWASLEAHKDDIISAAFWKPHYLATGTFDGDIFIWHIEHGRLWRKIQIGAGHQHLKIVVNTHLIPPRTARSGRRRQPIKTSKMDVDERPPTRSVTFPVDLLLYLHHRNPDTHAPLLATEGNKINWWSTVDIGKPIASFFVTNEPGTSITALTTGANDTFLIVGDNKGSVSVWGIEMYASFRRFAEVVLEASIELKQRQPSSINDTNVHPPPLLHSWKASNGDLITSLCSFERHSVTMVVVGMVTGCVSLFTIDGEQIGMFNKIGDWSFSKELRHPSILKDIEESSSSQKTYDDILEEPVVESHDEINSSPVITHSPISNSPSGNRSGDVSNITTDVEKIKNTENYKTRNAIMRDVKQQKESWSMLGEKYNSNFKRRMEERKSRRQNFSDVNECPLKHSGGLGNLCSPFQALITKECEDFVLPRGLPLTPRMVANSIDPYIGNSLENITSFGN